MSKRTLAEDLRPAKRIRIDESTLPLSLSNAAATRPPPFQQPFQLLSFSYTSLPSPSDEARRVRTLEWNNASMKYYVSPPPSANLSYGYERWVKRPEERGRLDGLLEACLRSECEAERRRAGVITWRGVVTKILTAPYEDRDGWDLNIMSVGGILYIEEHTSDEKLQEKSNLTGNHRLMTYYGYAFESYCTIGDPQQSSSSDSGKSRQTNGWGGDVDTNEQWCSVVKTKLGSVRMIIGGEVDCVRDRYTGQPDTFVELKTSMAIRPGNSNDVAKFEKKMLKFYFQSFLLGVPEIIVGFRTPSGHLKTVQCFKTMDLPRNVRGKPGAWDPAVCLTWGTRVFDFIRHRTSMGSDKINRSEDESGTRGGIRAELEGEDDPERGVWRLTFTPGIGLSIHALRGLELEDVTAGEDRIGFLPRAYWERVRSTSTSGCGSHGIHDSSSTPHSDHFQSLPPNSEPMDRGRQEKPESSLKRNPEETQHSGIAHQTPAAAQVQGWQV